MLPMGNNILSGSSFERTSVISAHYGRMKLVSVSEFEDWNDFVDDKII